MSKRQRLQGDELLFSQSELAELDAELAPQPEDAASTTSQRSPARVQPASVDELVDTAFSDEETAEKKPALSSDPDLGAGFDGFVEAEPANTEELMAVMAQQEPISSVAAPPPSGRPSGPMSGKAGGGKLAVGEIAGARRTSQPEMSAHLPSVIFDDSPFLPEEHSPHDESGVIAPQLAALAAAIDSRGPGQFVVSETVLSSSPPPNNNHLAVEVGTEGGGSLRNVQATAIAALAHAVQSPAPLTPRDAPDDEHEPDVTVEHEPEPEPAERHSSTSTPVVALDDNDFNLLEDSEERLVAAAAPASATSAAESDAELATQETLETEAVSISTSDVPNSWTAETQTEAPALDAAGIDASWAEAADIDSGPVVEALPDPGSDSGEQASPGADAAEALAGDSGDGTFDSAELDTGPVPEVSASALSPINAMEEEPEALTGPTAAAILASAATPVQELAPLAAQRRPSAGPAPMPPPPPAAATKPAPPPPPAAATKPAPPPVKPVPTPASKSPPPPAPNFGDEQKLRKKRRSKQWFEEIFDEDYLHTLPFMTPQQTEREVAFLLDALELPQGGRVLDIGCGYGRHAMEIAARGHRTVGLDLSLPLLIRATDAARRVGVNVDFVHGDMRDMTFDAEFEGAYCYFTTFGYFDDDTNRRVAAGICRSLKPGGRFVLDLINRDYLIGDLPTRVWWQGDGCVVLEEVDFNYFTSRLQVQRQIILEDGRQLEQEISIRAYSLHEIGKVLHHAGFRVLEVSGGLDLRGRFYGNESRQLLVVAEKKSEPSALP